MSVRSAVKADTEIGQRVALFRRERGLSQAALAKAIGISYQQLAKYESGRNRISSSALQAIARALGASPSQLLGSESGPQDQLFELHRDLLAVEGASTLLKDYAMIQDEQLQREILVTVKSLVRLEQSRISAPIEKPPAAETPTGHRGRIRGRTP
jgi:transcriptional regulator with XRE-family HTH domain